MRQYINLKEFSAGNVTKELGSISFEKYWYHINHSRIVAWLAMPTEVKLFSLRKHFLHKYPKWATVDLH